ncbi:MAG: right-handed parallel beta-helix repeat-containing protein [Candidatus Neomarinimicrobiota bacterium]
MYNRLYLKILFLTSFTMADVLYVPDDYSTIQSAIEAAGNGDSVIVSPGFYTETIDFEGKSITVSSLYLIEDDSLLIGSTIIDAQEDGSVATFSSGEDSGSVLQGFTLQNGTGNDEDPDDNGSFYTYGGGIYCENSSPVIRDCIIRDNVANEGGGGGIFCYEASPTFSGCMITGNETDDVGGGLYTRSASSPIFYDCTFYDNVAEFGGGCYMRNESTPIMENVVFNDNTANNSGGGITLKDDADLVATGLFITNNEADGLGGGFYVNNANPQLDFSLIADNVASSGAGVYFRNSSVGEFTNVTISNNAAGLYGNGIYMRDGSDVSLLNTVVWGNGSPQIYFRSEGTDVDMSIDYSIIQDGEDGVEVSDNGDLNWGTGNLNEDPYFCNPAESDYYVRENSSCEDGGQNGALIGCYPAGCGPVNVGPVWYVDHNGNNTNDGSLDAPFETIARAIISSVDGDTIRLKEGVYYEPIDFNGKEIVLESRTFELDDPQVIIDTYFTSGPLGGTCLTLNGSSNNNGTIRGISFKGGVEPSGGGLEILNCSPTLEQLIIEGNSADIGGGIYLSGSDAILIDLIIRDNGASFGGGMYVTNGSPSIDGLVIEDNIAYWGGGIYSENAEPVIRHSTIKYNEAFIEGAGLYQTGGSGSIEWTAFEHNNGYDYGGGIVAHQSTLDLDQVTFAGNISGVGSVMALYSSVINIENSILWSNDGPIIYSPETSGVTYLEVNYSDVEGGEGLFSEFSNIIFTTEGGIFDQDPGFCSPGNSFYALQQNSACQSASDSLGVIGAYEQTCEQVNIDQEVLVEDFLLFQNYPNPFNPITQIAFTLRENGHFSLRIFDIKGNLVKKLKMGQGKAGDQVVTWDSTDETGQKVSSGIYFYQLKTEKKSESNRMLLLK